MKALTVHQPHAFLIGDGPKVFETRSWKTTYRGLLAIHTAKMQLHELDGLVVDLYDDDPTYLEPYNHYLPRTWSDYFGGINHGGIECLAVLEFIIPGPEALDSLRRLSTSNVQPEDIRRKAKHAAAFGDFSPGRWAWKLDVKYTVQGNVGGVIRGHQGLWNLPAKTELELLHSYRKQSGEMICRVCGCHDSSACITSSGPCHWEADFLCSACVDKVS